MHTTTSQSTGSGGALHLLKAISWWAATNKRKGRVIIFLLYIPYTILALLLNEELLAMHVQLPFWAIMLLIGIAILSVITYRHRRMCAGKDQYMQRKLGQVLLSAATFCSIVWMFNTKVLSEGQWGTPVYGSMPYSLEKPREAQISVVVSSGSGSAGRLVQKIDQLRQWYREQQQGVQIMLTILTCIFATVVFVALAAASCLLVCEGYAFIGVALFVLGTVGIVLGTIALVRKIWGMESRGRKRYH
jgi:hypothetical protein